VNLSKGHGIPQFVEKRVDPIHKLIRAQKPYIFPCLQGKYQILSILNLGPILLLLQEIWALYGGRVLAPGRMRTYFAKCIKNKIQNVKKIRKKILPVYLGILMFVHKFLGERNILCGLCKKEKKTSKQLYWSIKNLFVIWDIKNIIFPQKLMCEHRLFRCTCNFFSKSFDILKCACCQTIGSYIWIWELNCISVIKVRSYPGRTRQSMLHATWWQTTMLAREQLLAVRQAAKDKSYRITTSKQGPRRRGEESEVWHPRQGLIGLIGYSYNKVYLLFRKLILKELQVKRAWPGAIWGWVTDREVIPGCARVRTKCAEKTSVGLWGTV
jgi:hypothetical protein